MGDWFLVPFLTCQARCRHFTQPVSRGVRTRSCPSRHHKKPFSGCRVRPWLLLPPSLLLVVRRSRVRSRTTGGWRAPTNTQPASDNHIRVTHEPPPHGSQLPLLPHACETTIVPVCCGLFVIIISRGIITALDSVLRWQAAEQQCCSCQGSRFHVHGWVGAARGEG